MYPLAGTAITGPDPAIGSGRFHSNDATSKQAQYDAHYGYADLMSLQYTADMSKTPELAGKTLLPGVYYFSSSASLTGTLTFDAKGNTSAIFVIQVRRPLWWMAA